MFCIVNEAPLVLWAVPLSSKDSHFCLSDFRAGAGAALDIYLFAIVEGEARVTPKFALGPYDIDEFVEWMDTSWRSHYWIVWPIQPSRIFSGRFITLGLKPQDVSRYDSRGPNLGSALVASISRRMSSKWKTRKIYWLLFEWKLSHIRSSIYFVHPLLEAVDGH